MPVIVQKLNYTGIAQMLKNLTKLVANVMVARVQPAKMILVSVDIVEGETFANVKVASDYFAKIIIPRHVQPRRLTAD